MKKTDIGLIPEDWEICDFEASLSNNVFSKKNLIETSQFKREGIYPVIDQGQDYIAGYSDLVEKVYTVKEPVIVFGDHTRIFKYVDFHFIGGADGIKVLTPNPKLFDTRYFYFALRKLDIPSRGYNRHFKLLKEKKIFKPPLPEQHKIAHILTTIQQAIEKQEQIIKTTQELKKVLMQKLFTEGLNNEPQKQTEIGLIPNSWEVVPMKDILQLQGGYAFKSSEQVPISNTQLVRMGNLYQNRLQLDRTPVFYPDTFADNYEDYLISPADLIISLTGTMGKEDYGFTVKVPENFSKDLLLNQRVARIKIVKPNNIENDFLYYFLLSRVFLDKLYKTAKGTKQANLSVKEIYNLKVVLPSISEQKIIGQSLCQIDFKIESHLTAKNKFQDLFKTMLNQLMTGQIRVKDMELEKEELSPAE